MLDLKTGRFIIGEGMEIYPGMKREDFLKTEMFKSQLYREKDYGNTTLPCYDLKVQEIDGYRMIITVWIDGFDYIDRIEMSKPEYYDWPNWPEGTDEYEYAYDIKRYNDEFIESQIKGQIREGNSIWFDCDWGSISSSIGLMHFPQVFINIRYFTVPFLEEEGYEFDISDL